MMVLYVGFIATVASYAPSIVAFVLGAFALAFSTVAVLMVHDGPDV